MALKSMREGMKPVMWAVAAAFVLSLFFVGATTLRKIVRGDEGGPPVLVVGGKKIGQKQFEQVFYREMGLRYRKYQREQKKPLTEEAERDLRLTAAGAAMNQIIQKELILREAKRMGLRVPDEEVRSYLVHNENFQVAGEFDQSVYERWLQEQMGMTPGEFEAELRDFILMERVMAVVGDAGRISEAEARVFFDQENEKVRVAYAFVPATPAATPPPDEQLKKYYDAHADKYRAGRRVRVKYFLVDLESQRKKIKTTDAAVKEYYERNKTFHFDAGEIHARHILFLVPPGAPAKAWDEARAKAEAAAARVKGGEDFAAVARALSEDKASAAKGGDLGYFGRGQMDQDFENAAYALKEGEASGAVKSIYGYHVIKREADIPSFAEEKENIKQILTERAVEEQAMNAAMDLRAKWVETKGEIDAQAQVLGFKAKEPPPFEEDGEVEGLGRQPQLVNEAFTLNPGDVGSVVPIADFDPQVGYKAKGYAVYEVVGKMEPGPSPFAQVKERVAADYARDAALDAVAAKAAALFAGAQKTGDLEKAAQAEGATYAVTGDFTRGSPPSEVGFNIPFTEKAFGIPAGATVGPVRTPRGYYVIKVLAKTPADPALYATHGEEYRNRLQEQRRQQIQTEWYRDLVARARVQNNLSAYLRTIGKGTGEREDDFANFPGSPY